MVQRQSDISAGSIADCVNRFRARRPHVHCITNSVAQHFTANVLLAAGARPSMTIAIEEISDFVVMSDALLINLGTLDNDRREAIALAVAVAVENDKPWALDPVFAQAPPTRLALAHQLLEKSPPLVRCNLVEASALFGSELDDASLSGYAMRHATTIALTGKVDRVFNGSRSIEIFNGNPLMDRITAMGCALTAITIGFLASEEDHLLAAVSALAFFGLAGEVAGEKSEGPGTFVAHFLDALANLSIGEIKAGVKLA